MNHVKRVAQARRSAASITMPRSGILVTVSGLDGAGKTTQLERLRGRLEARGERCIAHQFDVSDFGDEASNTLQTLLAHSPQWLFTRHTVDWVTHFPLARAFIHDVAIQTPALALAVQAMSAGSAIQFGECCLEPLLRRGVNVVCDRYWFDDLVFRAPWIEADLIKRLHAALPRPDLAIYLDIDVETAAARNRARPDAKTPLLKSRESVAGLRTKFQEVAIAENMVCLDGVREPSVVTDELLQTIDQTRERVAALAR